MLYSHKKDMSSKVKYSLTVKSLAMLLIDNGLRGARIVQSNISDVNRLEVFHDDPAYMGRLLRRMREVRPVEFGPGCVVDSFRSRGVTYSRVIVYPRPLQA